MINMPKSTLLGIIAESLSVSKDELCLTIDIDTDMNSIADLDLDYILDEII